MTELSAFWTQWLRPSAGLPTLQWALLLALATAAGHLVHRYAGLPKVLGYSVVGAFAGLAGFSGAAWPLEGTALFLIELGLAVVLFEAGARIPLRWFRHNPMVLAQSLLGALITGFGVHWVMRWLGVAEAVAVPLALIAVAASPAVLSRVAMDARAAGPVTERALTLATLSTLYALALGSAYAEVMPQRDADLFDAIRPVLSVLGVSVSVGAALALALRVALRFMNPTSENTSILLLALIGASAAVAAPLGGSAPLAALLGGMLLKQLHPQPWTWPRQLGTAATLLTMLMFVLVSIVAAQADWNAPVAGLVLALIGARALAQVLGVALANPGSGASWRQALWTGCAMVPMSSVALLITSQFAAASPAHRGELAGIALPAILLMEVLGAIIATFALYRAGECSRPWRAGARPAAPTSEPRRETLQHQEA